RMKIGLFSRENYVSQEERDEFVPGALETNYYKGQLYGLPLNFVCVALYYNKTLVPDPPETWDEFLAIAKEVADPDKNIAAIQIPGGGYGAWIWPAFVAAAGGTMLNEDQTKATFNDEAGQAALQLWVDLIKLSPKHIREAADAFPAGHLAFLVSGPWEYEGWRVNYPDFKDYGITLIPKKVKYATNIGGQNLVVYSSSKYPDQAVKLLKFLTSDEIQAMPNFVFEGNPSKKALKDLYKDDPDHQAFSEQLQYATPRPTVVNWIKINDEVIATAIDRAFAGEPVKQVLDEAAEQANAILATEP
ncbi:multiple sugar transport system substrate-binding protein, partial [Candidatus Hakubella thermalkaliphila]